MRNLVAFFFLLFVNNLKSQTVITIPTWCNDILSEDRYRLIKQRHEETSFQHLARTAYFAKMEKEYAERLDELKRISTGVKGLKDDIQKFINSDSNDIIAEKYPIFSLTNGPDLRNAIKRNKYRSKFTKYIEYTNKALNSQNPITEAKRTLFLLQIVEEVVNTTVKTERKYE